MKIAIDAGHGTNTAGKRTPPMPIDIDFNKDGIIDVKKGDRIKEHVANVGVAYLLTKELERCGMDIFKTGFNDDNPYNDEDTPLSTRQAMIKNAKCDYVISVHFNAYGDGESFNKAEGIGIYIHNVNVKESKTFAEVILKHLVKGSKQVNRGVSSQALAMCNTKNMNVKGAILLELAFMTNEREAIELMGSKEYWKECAVEVAKGLCEYLGVKYVETDETPKKTVTKTSSKLDIMWLQNKLNKSLGDIPGLLPITVDGIYGNKTRIALLIYWEKLGWNKSGEGSGWSAGASTITSLSKL